MSGRVLGTAQEEFDIASGYWAKWQRCKEEKAELLEVCRDIAQGDSRKDAELWWGIVEAARRVVAKVEGVR